MVRAVIITQKTKKKFAKAKRAGQPRASTKKKICLWLCDACEGASFKTYREAEEHEAACRGRRERGAGGDGGGSAGSSPPLPHSPPPPPNLPPSSVDTGRKKKRKRTVWRCDVCKEAAFEDYEECVAHEAICDALSHSEGRNGGAVGSRRPEGRGLPEPPKPKAGVGATSAAREPDANASDLPNSPGALGGVSVRASQKSLPGESGGHGGMKETDDACYESTSNEDESDCEDEIENGNDEACDLQRACRHLESRVTQVTSSVRGLTTVLCDSCDRCRAQKIKCDGGHPCGPCKWKYMKRNRLICVDAVDVALFKCVYSPAKKRGPVPGKDRRNHKIIRNSRLPLRSVLSAAFSEQGKKDAIEEELCNFQQDIMVLKRAGDKFIKEFTRDLRGLNKPRPAPRRRPKDSRLKPRLNCFKKNKLHSSGSKLTNCGNIDKCGGPHRIGTATMLETMSRHLLRRRRINAFNRAMLRNLFLKQMLRGKAALMLTEENVGSGDGVDGCSPGHSNRKLPTCTSAVTNEDSSSEDDARDDGGKDDECRMSDECNEFSDVTLPAVFHEKKSSLEKAACTNIDDREGSNSRVGKEKEEDKAAQNGDYPYNKDRFKTLVGGTNKHSEGIVSGTDSNILDGNCSNPMMHQVSRSQ